MDLIVDSDNMPAGAGVTAFGKTAEVEPGRVVWYTDSLRSVSFYNEIRNWDESARVNPMAAVLIKTFDSGSAVKLKDGYNCSLSYLERSGKLVLNGAPGNGEGRVPEGDTPWDIPPTTAQKGTPGGIVSINGVTGNDSGNIRMLSGADMNFIKNDGELIIRVGDITTEELSEDSE
jgi:hypothetical protein